jgi:hypothetical protein
MEESTGRFRIIGYKGKMIEEIVEIAFNQTYTKRLYNHYKNLFIKRGLQVVIETVQDPSYHEIYGVYH